MANKHETAYMDNFDKNKQNYLNEQSSQVVAGLFWPHAFKKSASFPSINTNSELNQRL